MIIAITITTDIAITITAALLTAITATNVSGFWW